VRLPTAICAACVVIVLSFAASPARADGVRTLRYDTRIDVAVTAVGGIWWVSSELLKADLVPEKCRWCYRAEDGSDLLNPYDGWVRRRCLWKNTSTANIASNALGFFIEPGAMMGLTALAAAHDKAIEGFPVDALLITEATVIAADVNQLAKFAFARERPFVHFLPRAPDAVRALTDSPSDDNLSFFSGHTTLAFAIGTAAPMITTLRGYRLAPVVWTAGLTMAASIGYLRIAADKHYFSDVMVGAVVGSLIGIGVPLIFHSPNSTSTSSANPPSASGQALTMPPVQSAFQMSGAF
jgi:membrane-associated phospholipid phosphatase